jgi:hypothetical protein
MKIEKGGWYRLGSAGGCLPAGAVNSRKRDSVG